MGLGCYQLWVPEMILRSVFLLQCLLICSCDFSSLEKKESADVMPSSMFGVSLGQEFSLDDVDISDLLGIKRVVGVYGGSDIGTLEVHFEPAKTYEAFIFEERKGSSNSNIGVGNRSTFYIVSVPNYEKVKAYKVVGVEWMVYEPIEAKRVFWMEDLCHSILLDLAVEPVWDQKESGSWHNGCTFSSNRSQIRISDMHSSKRFIFSLPDALYRQEMKIALDRALKLKFEKERPY